MVESLRTKGFQSLLVPLDLSPGSGRVTERAATLPMARGAQLMLVHVVPRLLLGEARRRAEHDARKSLEGHARQLRRAASKDLKIEIVVKSGLAATEIAREAETRKVDLVVLGRGSGRALRDAFLGSTAERIVRQIQRPILAVRLPVKGAYRRPVVALDADEAAHRVLPVLLRALAPPAPRIVVVHAYETLTYGGIYPSLATAEAAQLREESRKKAHRELAPVIANAFEASKKTSPLWKLYLRYGSARTVVQKAADEFQSDLLALGTRGHAGVKQALIGSVAGDVLREVTCDVLVVPPSAHAPRTERRSR